MTETVFVPLFSAQQASQTLAYVLGILVVFGSLFFWIKKRKAHYEDDEEEHADSIKTSFRRVPMTMVENPDEVLKWDDRGRLYSWWFKRFRAKLKGHMAPYAVQLRMVEEKDANEESIYLARVGVFHNRNSYSYKLAARDQHQLLKAIHENYVTACFEDKVPDPHEFEYQFDMIKNGFVDFEENSERLTGDIITRLHYNASDTPPESKAQMIKEALKDDPEQDPLELQDLEKRFVKDFRYPRDRVENVLNFLVRNGQVSIDDDGVIHSYL